MLHLEQIFCYLSRILIGCPSLSTKRNILLNSLESFNIPFNVFDIVNSNLVITSILIIFFVREAGRLHYLNLFVYI
jgi:hypothetical protein